MTAPWTTGQNGVLFIDSPHTQVTPQGVLQPDPLPEPARLNPYTDSGPWGTCVLGGLLLPGLIQDIDGAEKPEEWSVQKGTGTNHATTVWKGTKLAEAIKITLAAHDVDSFDGLYDLQKTVRPKLGEKPPSLLITNAAINFNGILLVALVNVGQPKWNASKNYWTVTLTLIEFNPSKPANAGPASPAKPGNKEPTAQDAADKEIQDLLNEAKKA